MDPIIRPNANGNFQSLDAAQRRLDAEHDDEPAAGRVPRQPTVTRFGDVWLLGKTELPVAPLRDPLFVQWPAGREPYSIAFPASVDGILRHWILSTGNEPLLAETGETFSAVAARRGREADDDDGSVPAGKRG